MRFAHLKTHHRFERNALAGLSGAHDEFHLAAIVQNLKTLASQLWRRLPTSWRQASCERQPIKRRDEGQKRPPKREETRIKGADRQLEHPSADTLSTASALSGPATTAEEIAKKFGVSPSTVRQATTIGARDAKLTTNNPPLCWRELARSAAQGTLSGREGCDRNGDAKFTPNF